MVVAVFRGIFPADLGPRFINPAPIISLQMLATRIDPQIPLLLFDEDKYILMDEIPANVIILPAGFGLVDLQDEIPATKGGTLIAKTGTAHRADRLANERGDAN